MMPNCEHNRRTVYVLVRAYKIVISLKYDQYNNHLNVAMLDELENHLADLLFIIRDLDCFPIYDEINIQKIIWKLLAKLMRCIAKLFNIPLSCIQYLECRF